MEQKTQKTDEVYRSILEEIMLPAFNAWFNSLDLDERGELARLPGKVIAENYGYNESSPFALMFTGFAGGAMATIFDSQRDEESEK